MSTIRVDKIMPFQSSSVEILGSFNGTYTGSFTGTFVGDGSGLTGIVAEASIDSSSFATTGSNTFVGNQVITGSLTVSGSNTFTNIGRTELTGSVEVDGDVGVYGNITVVQKTIEVLGFPTNQPAFYSEGDIILSGSLSIHVEELGQSFDVAEQFQQAFSSISFTQGELEIISSSYATTGSNSFRGNQSISGSLTVSGSVAQEVTGSVNITGSLNVSGSVNVDGSGFIILAQVSSSYDFADDSTAASGGVPLGGLYHTSGTIKIRLV
jgi:hypothetical protein